MHEDGHMKGSETISAIKQVVEPVFQTMLLQERDRLYISSLNSPVTATILCENSSRFLQTTAITRWRTQNIHDN